VRNVIVLLVLIAFAVAVATAVPQLARGSHEIDPGRLARRISALLLVVVAFVVALGNGSAVSSATYAMFAGVAALVMVALGAFWLYRDRASGLSRGLDKTK
jgi:amino acid permease